jgi:Ala-tRNA(Pro) deacylase
MGIALSLQQYLSDKHVEYDYFLHPPTRTSTETATAGHVPSDCLAKAVVLKWRDSYVLAVVPASRQAGLDDVERCLGFPVALAAEDEFAPLFPDCELGAVPPIGAAYGFQSVVDRRLEAMTDIYFEAGDHRTLVHMSGDQFRKLMAAEPHGDLCDDDDDAAAGSAYAGA